MRDFLQFVGRLGNATMDAINRHRKKNSANAAAATIANGGKLLKSDESFSDLAAKSGSDKPE